MSVANFIPELWFLRTMRTLEKALVFGSLCNRDYEGEIQEAGDTVRINTIGPVTVDDYVSNTTEITPEELNDAQQTLLIDQSKYFAFKVDDVDKAQAKGNLLAGGIQNSAYAVRDTLDQYIAGLYLGASNITAETDINSINALAALLSLAEALDDANIPTEGRWCVIPPWYKTVLIIAKILVENTTNEAFDNGRIGRAAGFDLHLSNNCPAGTTDHMLIAGTNKAISFAQQVTKIEAFRIEKGFGDAIKGLNVFGAKVVYPDALAVLDAKQVAEP